MQIQDGAQFLGPPVPGPIGGIPPHWLGPPVTQAPPIAQMLGIGPRLRAPQQQEEKPHNPHHAAAMVEMGKFFQAHGKMLQAQEKAREAQGTMQQAMQMAKGGGY